MTRLEAYKELMNGELLTHRSFDPEEYLILNQGAIVNQDGLNQELEFWDSTNNIFSNNWELYTQDY